MRRSTITVLALLSAFGPGRALVAQTHDVKLHVNPRWKQCSFQLDPSLTQSAWHQFSQEAGIVTFFRPLADAAPMGKGQLELSLMQWQTGIHDTDAAWNDTFVHPDSTHWLFEGSGLSFPGLMLRAGVADRTDAGLYFTKSPGANYGFYGGQLQHAFLQESTSGWSAATRVSFVSMYGPKDLSFTVYGVEAVASKRLPLFARWASISPYVGVSSYLSRAHEKSSLVNLRDENVLGLQGTAGAAAQLSVARISVEYGIARVSSFSMKLGVSKHL